MEGAQRLLQAFFGGKNTTATIHYHLKPPDPCVKCLFLAASHPTCLNTWLSLAVSKGCYAIKQMNEGVTNIVLHCRRVALASPNTHPGDVLIRVYGSKTEVRLPDPLDEFSQHDPATIHVPLP
jgi:hypothetical protein